MKSWKLIAVVLVAFSTSMFVQHGYGQSKSGPSSSSSSKPPSSSSSSKPPSSSGTSSAKPPSSSNPTRPPSSSGTSSAKPPSSNPAAPPSGASSAKPPSSGFSNPNKDSSPKFASPNSQPKTEQPPVAAQPAQPKSKFSSPAAEQKKAEQPPVIAQPTQPKPKFSSPSQAPTDTSRKPGTPPPSSIVNESTSRKPTAPVNQSAKAESAERERSRRVYAETQQAKAPPKPVYTTPEGRTVNVRTDSQVTSTIRSNPSSYYRPEVRQQRYETHVHHYHYQHPTNWYYSQPPIYVGGGYSSAFWWMMMEWDAERRAQWFYNHQNTIERDAYQRGMQDAAVAQRVAQLKAQNAPINQDYVDPEFAKDPSLMYTQDHIEAVYNPEVVHSSSSGAGTVLMWLAIVGVLCVAAYVLMFQVRWGK
jgi:hypothetical protein